MSILKREDPQTIVNILNGNQTILVMKQAPKNGEGCWWYLYCGEMLDKEHGTDQVLCDFKAEGGKDEKYFLGGNWGNHSANDIEMPNHNGKVVARFWCDKVEEIKPEIWTPKLEQEILKGSCLTENDLFKYISKNNGEKDNPFFAIHISKLEIFDRPKELSEFSKPHTITDILNVSCEKKNKGNCNYGKSLKTGNWIGCNKFRLTKAPQNYCYVKGD